VNVKPNVQPANKNKSLWNNDIYLFCGNKKSSTRPQIACAATMWIC
jgi:hypothetical protein